MPSDVVPLVHVGYHKTATTWLQRRFFPLLGDKVKLVGPELLRRNLIAPSPFAFDADRCRRLVVTAIARQSGRVCVFSDERLSGHPHSGGYDAAELAERLKAVFGNARILIVVREQVSMLAATYKQYIRGGGICTLDEYLRPPPDYRIPLFRPDHFCYHHLVERYRERFGARVLVLPYELLVRDRIDFVRRLLEYIGVDGLTLPAECIDGRRLNVSPTDLHVRLLRRVNLLSGGNTLHPVTPRAPRLARLLSRLVRAVADTDAARRRSGRLQERAAVIAGDRYAASNRAMQYYVNCDLRSLGYRL